MAIYSIHELWFPLVLIKVIIIVALVVLADHTLRVVTEHREVLATSCGSGSMDNQTASRICHRFHGISTTLWEATLW